ncbi:MAG: RluA family pseudouridine synthase [Clostridiales bacterium]|nr:RluA family pseudouridine synthase [Clostridiales bacterium]
MKYTIENENVGVRLDVFLSQIADVTRSRAGTLIKEGNALVNQKPETKTGYALRLGDEIDFHIPDPAPAHVEAQDIPLRIVYQDDDLAVVYKPSGMVVHPAAGNPDGTMVNALLKHLSGLSGIGGEIRPGIVHRIDKDTSGLLLVAKNDKTHVALAEKIAEHDIERAYRAIVIGHMKMDFGTVEGPIGRHPSDRKKMAIVPNGKEAKTHWRVIEELKGATYLECILTTGRTHQIRVHMASIGHPVLGDPVYGPKKSPYPVEGGQLLHAFRLGFTHPTTGEKMLFEEEAEARFLTWKKKLSLT